MLLPCVPLDTTTCSSPLFFICPPTLYPFPHNPTQLGPSLRGHMVRPCGPECCCLERNAREDPSAAWGPGRRTRGEWCLGRVWGSEPGQGTVGQRGAPGREHPLHGGRLLVQGWQALGTPGLKTCCGPSVLSEVGGRARLTCVCGAPCPPGNPLGGPQPSLLCDSVHFVGGELRPGHRPFAACRWLWL